MDTVGFHPAIGPQNGPTTLASCPPCPYDLSEVAPLPEACPRPLPNSNQLTQLMKKIAEPYPQSILY